MPTRTFFTTIQTLLVLSLLGATAIIGAQTTAGLGQWRIAGRDAANSRHQPSEHSIGPANVDRLEVQWVFTTGSDVSATPTVAGNTVYFPDWDGNLFAVRAGTGQLLWSHRISEYNGRPNSISRVSPAVFEDSLIVGDNVATSAVHDGAHVMSVDRNSGELRWITQVDAHPAAIITGSPVFDGSTVYVGVSSIEEGLATNPAYPCCTFRGSLVALDATTGAILWKTYTLPDNHGATNAYSGNAIWSPPAIDTARGTLYIGTGNNYTVPDAVLQCRQQALDEGQTGADCAAADDFFDTVLALDQNTGAVKWATRLSEFDAWTVACLSNPAGPNCPSPSGPDFDFPGSGPNLIGNTVGIGQKSGMYWALDASTGQVVWSTQVGPGGTTGGIQWGTATDGVRIYVAITNSGRQPYTLANGGPTITWGSWAALDVQTGQILWQTADPAGALDPGAVSTANDVVYAGSYSGAMHALNARTGEIRFSFDSGGSVIDAPAIVNGTLYWGSGYRRIGGVGNNQVYSFRLRK